MGLTQVQRRKTWSTKAEHGTWRHCPASCHPPPFPLGTPRPTPGQTTTPRVLPLQGCPTRPPCPDSRPAPGPCPRASDPAHPRGTGPWPCPSRPVHARGPAPSPQPWFYPAGLLGRRTQKDGCWQGSQPPILTRSTVAQRPLRPLLRPRGEGPARTPRIRARTAPRNGAPTPPRRNRRPGSSHERAPRCACRWRLEARTRHAGSWGSRGPRSACWGPQQGVEPTGEDLAGGFAEAPPRRYWPCRRRGAEMCAKGSSGRYSAQVTDSGVPSLPLHTGLHAAPEGGRNQWLQNQRL